MQRQDFWNVKTLNQRGRLLRNFQNSKSETDWKKL